MPKRVNKIKILLANPPWIEKNQIGHRAGARFPFMVEKTRKDFFVPFPFFLAYSTSLLKKNGINAKIIDSIAEGESYEKFYEKVKNFHPDVLLIETSTPSFPNDINVAKHIKDTLGTKIAFSGPHVSAFREKILEEFPFVDFVLYGEYEFTILDLAKTLENGKNLKNIKGLVYREKNKIVKNSERGPIKDFNDLPWPERESLPMYNYYGIAALPTPQVQVWATRGCPFHCIFCVWAETMFKNKFRSRDPIDVANEVEYLIKKYGFKSVYFFDDSFDLWGKTNILKLCDEIKKRNLNIKWGAQMRADTLDYETLKKMREAGFDGALLGVESGNQEIIDRIRKNLDLNKVRQTIKWFKELGIKAHLTFTIGLPGETKETIRRTLEFAKELAPYSAQFSITTPFPGTEYYTMLERKKFILTKDWNKYQGGRNTVIRTENLTAEELQEEVEKLRNEWTKFNFWRKIKNNKIEYFKKAIKNPVRSFLAIKNYLGSCFP